MFFDNSFDSRMEFEKAVYANDTLAVSQMIDQGADPNMVNFGLTPICHALRAGNSKMFRLLVERNANPLFRVPDQEEIYDSRGHIPPIYFMLKYSPERFIIECLDGLDISKIQDSEGCNLLHLTPIANFPISLIPLLVFLGINPIDPNYWGHTPYRCAEIFDRNDIMTLFKDYKTLTGYRDSQRNTALHKAASRGDKKMAHVLLKMKMNVNESNVFYETALFEAVNRNDVAMTQLLIRYGADVNYVNYHGESPFSQAITNKAYDCALLLIKCGAKAKLEDAAGRIPLWNESSKNINQLISHLIDIAA